MKTITLEDGKEVKISDESYKAIADSIQSKRWKPEEDEDYWFVDEGYILEANWDNDEFDQYCYKTGNCYRTEKEARTALARIIALADIREYILNNNLQVDNVDWSDRDQEKWIIYYDHDYSEFYGGEINYIHQKLNELPWLKSEEAKDQVIQAKKKELLVIFNVK